ncbi:hypothetical protein MMIC_P1480 [Mariprofundus micogutta]|uniref:Uncharacterized protein n=1 Tax=Mariprofundus micogutta TaxID=1921010 RepID=A0A1L8CNL3_9PROT|nr:hypothetical protein [Mariprofundus micogutta]GAV20512.1 hypothetical protein MMIC_P1480 [Mariprofundus micogutta]
MGNSDSGNGISWPELNFPPINLWALNSSPVTARDGESTHNYRSQRPGMKDHENSLRNFGQVRMNQILTMRGGKR